MDKVNDKIGNVRLFKKHLRKKGLIGNRQQFSEEHVQKFEEVREYKNINHTTWEMAFTHGLKSNSLRSNKSDNTSFVVAEVSPNYVEETLTEILKVLKRIEEKL